MGLDRSGSGQGPVEGLCERGDESSRVAAQLAASQEGLSSMSEWVSDSSGSLPIGIKWKDICACLVAAMLFML
jgi:hypothetical protein